MYKPSEEHVKDVCLSDASSNASSTQESNPESNTESLSGMTILSGNPPNEFNLSWKDLEFSVLVSKKPKVMKSLLHSNSGDIKSGNLVAIMGGSGAGKSTLLNCLAGRMGNGQFKGQVLVNGQQRDKETWSSMCAFVEQDDLMFKNMTVKETIAYSARLRLPKLMNNEEKMDRVEQVIMQLGLDDCRDVYIGDSEKKGISGGERKRTAIGVELVADPSILFLDEPTSGLDAFTALNLIETLRACALKRNMIILLTIHQPRNDILKLFDSIILLSAGNMVWNGPLSDAMTHFENMGYHTPLHTNPSDFLLDIIALDQRTKEKREVSMKRITEFSDVWKSVSKQELKRNEDSVWMPPFRNPGISWFQEFRILLERNTREIFRDPIIIRAYIGQCIIMALFVGSIFFQLGFNQNGIQGRLGLLFFICINQMFGVVMPQISVFTMQRQIMKRERAAGTYRASSAYLAKVVSTIPTMLMNCILFCIPVYFMSGLQTRLSNFFIYVGIVVVHTLTANFLGLMIGSFVPTARVGQIIAPIILVASLLFGGQLGNLETIPMFLRWLQYVSVVAYSFKALSQNEFKGLVFNVPCPNNAGFDCIKTGESILIQNSLDSIYLGYNVLINASIGLVFLSMGYFFFRKTSAPNIQLN